MLSDYFVYIHQKTNVRKEGLCTCDMCYCNSVTSPDIFSVTHGPHCFAALYPYHLLYVFTGVEQFGESISEVSMRG